MGRWRGGRTDGEEALGTGGFEPTNVPYAIAKIAGIKLCESYSGGRLRSSCARGWSRRTAGSWRIGPVCGRDIGGTAIALGQVSAA
jgi:hypothetical protein